MSQSFFDSFFPEISELVQVSKYTRWLYHEAFPAEAAELCPESTIGGDLLIRNPILGVHAFCGVIVGIYGAFLLSNHSALWSIAFGSFAIMNIAAIPLHCLHSSTIHPEEAPLWWALDTYFTGASSTAICLAVSSFSVRDWMLVNVIVGWVSLFLFVQSSRFTFPLELWYALPTGLAGQVVLVWLTLSNTKASRQTLAWLVGVSAAMLGSVLADHWCCLWGIRMLDAFDSPTMVFFGCNLAFGILLRYLFNVVVENNARKKYL